MWIWQPFRYNIYQLQPKAPRILHQYFSGLGQLLFVILGFCAMLTVELAAPHNHEHGHEHEDDDHDHETTTTIIRTITKAMVY